MQLYEVQEICNNQLEPVSLKEIPDKAGYNVAGYRLMSYNDASPKSIWGTPYGEKNPYFQSESV